MFCSNGGNCWIWIILVILIILFCGNGCGNNCCGGNGCGGNCGC